MSMTRRRLLPAALLALPLLAGLPAHAETSSARLTVSDITIEQPWARAAVRGGTGGVFLTLRNNGSKPERLVSASSPLAHKGELHTSLRDGEVMRMRPVEAIEIPPGGSVTLRPGGLHIMLMQLTQPVPAGSTVPLTLGFEQAGTVEIQVPVQAAGARGPHAHP